MPHSKSSSLDKLKNIQLREISPEEAMAGSAQHFNTDNSNSNPSDSNSRPDSSSSSSPDDHPYRPSGSTIVRVLTGIQKYSSLAFAGFLGLHLTSVVLIPAFSYSLGNKALLFTNAIYQTKLTEPILITGSLTLHVLSGMALRGYRFFKSKQFYERWVSPLSKPSPVSIAGYLAIPLVASHFYMTRWLPSHVLGDSSLISLDYIANALSQHTLPVATSMLSMLSLVLYHSAWGMKRWWTPATSKPKFRSITTAVVSSGIVLGVASLVIISSQGPATGWLATQYQLIADASVL